MASKIKDFNSMHNCDKHSGICSDLNSLSRRAEQLENIQSEYVKNKLFYTLISILVILFAGIFSITWATKSELTGISTQLQIQGVKTTHITETISEIKKRMP